MGNAIAIRQLAVIAVTAVCWGFASGSVLEAVCVAGALYTLMPVEPF